MEAENLKISSQACFPLYVLSREITGIYRPYLDALDLTYPQYLVLMVLWEQQPQTVNAIGEILHLDSGTLTPLLKRLEAKKLISRQRKSCDERVVEITLTETGTELQGEARKIPEKVIQTLDISQDEINQLKAITRKILQRIQ
ncbi:MarR family transcriptional regulator [Weeksellaceae bacterium A-14]|uniref:MarR family winged helix-turn-helix transcriptional regulator n=1 Tax=Daejeonia sp. YH14 TaxID=3439042 RepID=UPI0031E4B188